MYIEEIVWEVFERGIECIDCPFLEKIEEDHYETEEVKTRTITSCSLIEGNEEIECPALDIIADRIQNRF